MSSLAHSLGAPKLLLNSITSEATSESIMCQKVMNAVSVMHLSEDLMILDVTKDHIIPLSLTHAVNATKDSPDMTHSKDTIHELLLYVFWKLYSSIYKNKTFISQLNVRTLLSRD